MSSETSNLREGGPLIPASEIIFAIEESPEGGYEARALGHPIFAEADGMEELKVMLRDAVRSDLIWAGISAMGPEYPKTPGYDPALQAMAGYMELTGVREGPPMLSGGPLIDLKAGDEVYANVLLALVEKAETGKGKEIHVSMLQARLVAPHDDAPARLRRPPMGGDAGGKRASEVHSRERLRHERRLRLRRHRKRPSVEEARGDPPVRKPGATGARDQRRPPERRGSHPPGDGRGCGEVPNVGAHGAIRGRGDSSRPHPHHR